MVHNKLLVAQSCLTLCDPMDCSLPGSSAHGIFQARILEWVAISFSRGIFPTQGSDPGIEPQSPAFQANSLLTERPGKLVHGTRQHYIHFDFLANSSLRTPPLVMYTLLLLRLLFSLKFCLFLIAKSFIRPTQSSNKSYPCLLPFSHNALFVH